MNRFSNRSILTAIGAILAFGIGYQVGNMINSSVTFAHSITKMSEQTNRRMAAE